MNDIAQITLCRMAKTALIQIKLHPWRTWPALALRRAGAWARKISATSTARRAARATAHC